MTSNIQDLILKATGAKTVFPLEVVQRLWSGYGEIVRYGLTGSDRSSIIVKHVKLRHTRHSNGNVSHQRKIRSYQVETAWYGHWSKYCDAACRIPACLAFESFGDEVLIVLEDLDTAGYAHRRTHVSEHEMHSCLHWLANFHATFIGEQPKALWPTGTYWHLETRPNELQALNDPALKNAATAIDQKLRASAYQTFVHGDAKLANFCFSSDGKHVAAVDFQYVGGGCGIKDVAYFIDSCLDADQAERLLKPLLDEYFQALKQALKAKQKPVDAQAVEQDWRALYPFAWTDFHRFLKGWSPGHWPSNSYSERLARQVIGQLQHTERTNDAFVGK